MNRLLRAVFPLALLCLWLLLPAPVQTQAGRQQRERYQGHDVVAGEVLVRFTDQNPARLADVRRFVNAEQDTPVGSQGWRRIRVSARNVQGLIQMLRTRGDVLQVEPNYILDAVEIPNDTWFGSLWGLRNTSVPGADIHAERAWDVSKGSAAVVVGVVDSGIQADHPDLAANMWSAPTAFTVNVSGFPVTCPAGTHGFNAIAFRSWLSAGTPANGPLVSAICAADDDYGHGTHVAGTIGAVGGNGVGVTGVNWTTRMMALKILDSTGSGNTGDAISALDFAIAVKAAFASSNGANVRVLSNSYGGGDAGDAFASAITRAATANMLFVAAAGNGGGNTDANGFYPASYTNPSIISVAATDANDAKAGFSNYGVVSVDLGAPGVSTLSTVPGGGYGDSSGTSMATPHVAGAAALVLSGCSLTTAQLKSALLNNVDVIPSMSGITVSGGRLNVDHALRSCATVPTVTMTSPPTGATFAAPATISLEATAADPEGIAKVEFFAGSTLIGAATTAPFGGTWSNVQPGSYVLTAKAYDGFGVMGVSAPVAVVVTEPGGGVPRINVAAASNGGTATASSSYSTAFPPSAVVNGDRRGTSWGSGGGWNDGTPDVYPDWVSVAFSTQATIDEISVFTLQDSWSSPTEPIPTTTFSQYGVRDFDIQYWANGTWQTVPGGHVVGNNQVWRRVIFPAVTTDRIRVWITNASGASRLVEVEAVGVFGGTVNPPPAVTLTNPHAGAAYTAPAVVQLSVDVSDANGIGRVEYYAGTVLLATVSTAPYNESWTNVPAGTYAIKARAYDTLGAWSETPVVEVVVADGGAPRLNVALASNGGTTTASSSYNSAYPVSAINNGDRTGANWGAGGGWNDATGDSYPDWAEIRFSTTATVDEIDVVTLQDAFTNPIAPTPSMTFSQYGVRDFDMQYWNNGWQTVPGGHITGNNLVWRKVTFVAVTTDRIRITITNAPGASRLVEVEAYGTFGGAVISPPSVTLTSPSSGATYTVPASVPLAVDVSGTNGIDRVEYYAGASLVATITAAPYGGSWSPVAAGTYAVKARAYDTLGAWTETPAVEVTVTNPGGNGSRLNVALATNGATATSSSSYSAAFPPSSVIDGDRTGLGWGAGAGWNDGTPNIYPDWIVVTFNGVATIDEVDVFTLQDNWSSPSAPTPTMTFSQFGVQDFDVQYWVNGAWQTVVGGHITANALIWRKVAFSPVTTDRIRILVTNAGYGASRLIEVEAHGAFGGVVNSPPAVTLTSPGDGSTYTVPTAIPLSVDVSDADGIGRVEYYAGTTLVATSTTSPYSATWTDVAADIYVVTARAFDTLGNAADSLPAQVTVNPPGGPRVNVALANSGAVATASSTYHSGFAVTSVNNGDRTGAGWGAGGGWNDATPDAYPDWVEIAFNGDKTIGEVDVFTLQDTFGSPVPPTPTLTFANYGVRDFDVQYWDNGAWQTVAGGHIVGNALVWRTVTFPTVTTSRIRVLISNAPGHSRLVEVEAY